MTKQQEELFDRFYDAFLPWMVERGMNPIEYLKDVNLMVGVFPAFMMWKHEQNRKEANV